MEIHPLAKEALISKSVNRIADRPLWLPEVSSSESIKASKSHARNSRKDSLEDVGLGATSRGKSKRAKSLNLDSQLFRSNASSIQPMTTITRAIFEQMNNSMRPGYRRLARRRDLIQMAPPNISIEPKSNYKRDFEGIQNSARVKAILPVDQGINGLESLIQLLNKENKNLDKEHFANAPSMEEVIDKPLCTATECPLKHIKDVYPKDSIYRSDFKKPLDVIKLLKDEEKNLPDGWKHRDNSTDYRANYHTWIDFNAPEEFTFASWKPSVAVYVAPDPRKQEKMSSVTSYKSEFKGESIEERAKQFKLPTSIDKFKLLNSVNGIERRLPKSLYQDTYVAHKDVENWSERHIHQNLKALSKQIGLSHLDSIYWKDVPTEPYFQYKKAVFSKTPKVNELVSCE